MGNCCKNKKKVRLYSDRWDSFALSDFDLVNDIDTEDPSIYHDF